MNKRKLKELAKKVRLQINDFDLNYFKRSFSVVLPMVDKLLSEKIASNTSTAERIISTPLELSELSKIRHRSSINTLSEEEIERNSSLKTSKIVIRKKHV